MKKKNRKSKNKLTHMWPDCFWQRCQGNSIRWTAFFNQKMVLKPVDIHIEELMYPCLMTPQTLTWSTHMDLTVGKCVCVCAFVCVWVYIIRYGKCSKMLKWVTPDEDIRDRHSIIFSTSL